MSVVNSTVNIENSFVNFISQLSTEEIENRTEELFSQLREIRTRIQRGRNRIQPEEEVPEEIDPEIEDEFLNSGYIEELIDDEEEVPEDIDTEDEEEYFDSDDEEELSDDEEELPENDTSQLLANIRNFRLRNHQPSNFEVSTERFTPEQRENIPCVCCLLEYYPCQVYRIDCCLGENPNYICNNCNTQNQRLGKCPLCRNRQMKLTACK